MIPQRALRCTTAWASLAERRIQARHARQFHASISRQHEVPGLDFNKEFEASGVADFLSPESFNIAWTQNMDRLIDRLNRSTAGSDLQNSTVKNIVLALARNPTFASIFSTASLAHNNHFFFQALHPIPNSLDNYPVLKNNLINSFGSIDILRKTMLTTANAMHGPGFVWLVQRHTSAANNLPGRLPEFKIMTTYNTGTPYAEAVFRKQGLDMNMVNNTAGSFGENSPNAQRRADLLPGTEQIVPILCVSTWEHVYLHDYKVGGKGKYLMKWWDAINWGFVDQHATKTKEQAEKGSAFMRS